MACCWTKNDGQTENKPLDSRERYLQEVLHQIYNQTDGSNWLIWQDSVLIDRTDSYRKTINKQSLYNELKRLEIVVYNEEIDTLRLNLEQGLKGNCWHIHVYSILRVLL